MQTIYLSTFMNLFNLILYERPSVRFSSVLTTAHKLPVVWPTAASVLSEFTHPCLSTDACV